MAAAAVVVDDVPVGVGVDVGVAAPIKIIWKNLTRCTAEGVWYLISPSSERATVRFSFDFLSAEGCPKTAEMFSRGSVLLIDLAIQYGDKNALSFCLNALRETLQRADGTPAKLSKDFFPKIPESAFESPETLQCLVNFVIENVHPDHFPSIFSVDFFKLLAASRLEDGVKKSLLEKVELVSCFQAIKKSVQPELYVEMYIKILGAEAAKAIFAQPDSSYLLDWMCLQSDPRVLTQYEEIHGKSRILTLLQQLNVKHLQGMLEHGNVDFVVHLLKIAVNLQAEDPRFTYTHLFYGGLTLLCWEDVYRVRDKGDSASKIGISLLKWALKTWSPSSEDHREKFIGAFLQRDQRKLFQVFFRETLLSMYHFHFISAPSSAPTGKLMCFENPNEHIWFVKKNLLEFTDLSSKLQGLFFEMLLKDSGECQTLLNQAYTQYSKRFSGDSWHVGSDPIVYPYWAIMMLTWRDFYLKIAKKTALTDSDKYILQAFVTINYLARAGSLALFISSSLEMSFAACCYIAHCYSEGLHRGEKVIPILPFAPWNHPAVKMNEMTQALIVREKFSSRGVDFKDFMHADIPFKLGDVRYESTDVQAFMKFYCKLQSDARPDSFPPELFGYFHQFLEHVFTAGAEAFDSADALYGAIPALQRASALYSGSYLNLLNAIKAQYNRHFVLARPGGGGPVAPPAEVPGYSFQSQAQTFIATFFMLLIKERMPTFYSQLEAEQARPPAKVPSAGGAMKGGVVSESALLTQILKKHTENLALFAEAVRVNSLLDVGRGGAEGTAAVGPTIASEWVPMPLPFLNASASVVPARPQEITDMLALLTSVSSESVGLAKAFLSNCLSEAVFTDLTGQNDECILQYARIYLTAPPLQATLSAINKARESAKVPAPRG